MSRPRVEILFFESCPNHEPARRLVERMAAELRIETELRLVEVTDAAAAAELRFIGSPTVRVDGVDVEPGAGARREYVLACRLYRREDGVGGQPRESCVRDALTRAAT